ncbi:unnamed protein product [Camellia sinensis]
MRGNLVRQLLACIEMETGLFIRRTLVVVLFCMWVPMKGIGRTGNASLSSSKPSVVNIGALYTFNSVIGRSTKPAIEAAVDDVNSDSTVLAGMKLNLILHDTNCSGFLGIVEPLQLMENDVVAVNGPQSSGIAHVISHVVNELHVPLMSSAATDPTENDVVSVNGPQSSGIAHVISHVINELHVTLMSFAATDPMLSALQFPYFLRTTHSDYFQMYAIADLIEFYGWREVVTIFVDNDYRRNEISVLGEKRAEISYKAAFTPRASRNDINDLLVRVNMMESQVYVVHVNPDSGLTIFSVAKLLRMLTAGYIWIATDWLPSVLDSSESIDPNTINLLQGIIALHHHTPDSDLKKSFTSSWKNFIFRETSSFNSYALEGGNISFSYDPRLHDINGSTLHLTRLRTFQEGQKLLQILLGMNFTGLTDQIQFDSRKNLILPAFDMLNSSGNGSQRIGYWSNYSSLSVIAPKILYVMPSNTSTSNQHLDNVICYLEYATKDEGPLGVKGYCIDVFEAAVKLLPYVVPHTYTLYGNGLRNPSYNNLMNDVAENLFRENIVSTLGRLVLILWLFVVLIINSSYTASLTSILTGQQLMSNIEGIDSLISSTNSIGVQDGSFAYNYLIEEYVDAVHKGPKVGSVAAIFDELPGIELLLYKINCKFRNVGQEFTKSRWGSFFKDFVDKKDDEVIESIKWKSDGKRQASQRSYGHPSSPSRS